MAAAAMVMCRSWMTDDSGLGVGAADADLVEASCGAGFAHDDQANALTELSRRLNKERRRPDGTTVGERITDNPLLRVAIDLLLARAGDLHGTTEQELAASLSLQPRQEDPA